MLARSVAAGEEWLRDWMLVCSCRGIWSDELRHFMLYDGAHDTCVLCPEFTTMPPKTAEAAKAAEAGKAAAKAPAKAPAKAAPKKEDKPLEPTIINDGGGDEGWEETEGTDDFGSGGGDGGGGGDDDWGKEEPTKLSRQKSAGDEFGGEWEETKEKKGGDDGDEEMVVGLEKPGLTRCARRQAGLLVEAATAEFRSLGLSCSQAIQFHGARHQRDRQATRADDQEGV